MARTISKSVVALALLAMAQPSAAAVPNFGCLTVDEYRSVAAYALPVVADAVIEGCTPHLAADGYLRTNGAALRERLAAEQDSAWPVVRRAVLETGDARTRREMRNMSDLAARRLFDVGMIQAIGELGPSQCQAVESVLQPLDPLPSANMFDVVSRVIYLAAAGDRRRGRCPAR